MGWLALEHTKLVYWTDFAFYGAVVGGLAAVCATASPTGQGVSSALLGGAGFASWSLIEYLLHRFVLHGVQPFQRWHAEHHRRPCALIASPTVFSAGLLSTLVVLPACWALGSWRGGALSGGVIAGYLAYTVAHHALHHWNFRSAWFRRRKRAHALHHHLQRPVAFGVTSGFWDRIFGSEASVRPEGR